MQLEHLFDVVERQLIQRAGIALRDHRWGIVVIVALVGIQVVQPHPRRVSLHRGVDHVDGMIDIGLDMVILGLQTLVGNLHLGDEFERLTLAPESVIVTGRKVDPGVGHAIRGRVEAVRRAFPIHIE